MIAAALRMGFGAMVAALAFGAEAQTDRCDNCGTVVDVRQTTQKTTWTPLGSVTPGTITGDPGANTGRVTANYQIGPEMKNQGMVLLGSAGGGAYARRSKEALQPRWEVIVKMDTGTTRSVSLGYDPSFRKDDRVRVFGTQLELIQP